MMNRRLREHLGFQDDIFLFCAYGFWKEEVYDSENLKHGKREILWSFGDLLFQVTLQSMGTGTSIWDE